MVVVEFDAVSKSYSHNVGGKLLRGHLQEHLRVMKREKFWALKEVSFRLQQGETMAVVGRNGAGKSTLLGLVAGLSEPSQGLVTVNGRVAALLELGSGFHPDLTGAENLRLNAALLGLSGRRTSELYEQIVDFSGIRDFIDEALRTYSSGMIMRLGFSVAVHVDPDILIVDEVLAVGDKDFQAKCFDKISEFKRSGRTLLFVSHAASLVERLCDRAIWLDRGEVIMNGQAREVVAAYTGQVAASASPPKI